MALNWNWDEKIGTLQIEEKRFDEWEASEIQLYEGNALLIMLNEYKKDGNDMYCLWSFFADKEHMKNMLGLNKRKGYSENVMVDGRCRITGIRLNKAKSRYWKDIVKAFSEAFDNIKIELYTE